MSNFNLKLVFFVLIFTFIFNVYHLSIGLGNPLREIEHGFRQCQTGITTYWLVKDGFRLDYETPILGPDWRIPIEFASFQYSTSLIVKLFKTPIDITGRLVSVFYFYFSLVFLFFILKELKLELVFILLAISCVLINLNYCFWPRAFLYETTALCFSLGFVFFSLRFFESNSIVPFTFALLFGVIAAPTKITTFVVYLIFTTFIFLVKASKFDFNHRTKAFFFGSLLLLAVPLLISTLWNNYADSFKSQHLLGQHLTTKSHLIEWVLWNWKDRFSIKTWDKILSESMFILKLFPFFILLYKLKFFKEAIISLGFWLVGPLLFTRLYYVHGYYNVANGLFLSLFVAFILYSLIKHNNKMFQYGSLILFCLIIFTNLQKFEYYFKKSLKSDYSDIFFTSQNIKKLVKEDETFLIYNADWNAELPYYSERKAIMLAGWFDDSEFNLDQLIKKCGETKIVGIAIKGDLPTKDSKIYKRIKYLGFNPDLPMAISKEGYWWHWYKK